MLTQAFWTSFRILAFRAGPEDMPYDAGRQLSAVCIAFALLANMAMASLLIQISQLKLTAPLLAAVVIAVATVAALGLFTKVLLRARQLDNRFQQTFHALLLTSSVLTLALLVPMHLLQPLMPQLMAYFNKLQEHPELAGDPTAVPVVPGWATPMSLLMTWLFVWQFVVTVFIYRRAANTRAAAGILIALLCVLTVKSFQTLFSIFIH